MSPERESIIAYLRMIASCEVGTILTPESREIVGWCASWIENRLDDAHHAARAALAAAGAGEEKP